MKARLTPSLFPSLPLGLILFFLFPNLVSF